MLFFVVILSRFCFVLTMSEYLWLEIAAEVKVGFYVFKRGESPKSQIFSVKM